ncbi:MAG: hypothetical protein IJW97_02585 [Clostridia bacterium]|nr:hypothetical protein [Clostridia bacterium]
MAKQQIVHVPTDDGITHEIRSIYRPLRHTLTLSIDNGEQYVLPSGAREELFRLGDEQAILCVKRNGSISVRTANGEFFE